MKTNLKSLLFSVLAITFMSCSCLLAHDNATKGTVYVGPNLGWTFNRYQVSGDFVDPTLPLNVQDASLSIQKKNGANLGLAIGYYWKNLPLPLLAEISYRYANMSVTSLKHTISKGVITIDDEAKINIKDKDSFSCTFGVMPHISEEWSIGLKLGFTISRFKVSYTGDLDDNRSLYSQKSVFGIVPGLRILWEPSISSHWTYSIDYDYRIYQPFTSSDVAADADASVKFKVKPEQHIITFGVQYHF